MLEKEKNEAVKTAQILFETLTLKAMELRPNEVSEEMKKNKDDFEVTGLFVVAVGHKPSEKEGDKIEHGALTFGIGDLPDFALEQAVSKYIVYSQLTKLFDGLGLDIKKMEKAVIDKVTENKGEKPDGKQ